MNIKEYITKNIKKAMIDAGINNNYDPQVFPSNKTKKFDYQSNGIISIAKKMGYKPKTLSYKIAFFINLKIFKKISISKQGFINFYLKESWLEKIINKFNSNVNFYKILKSKKIKKIVVDYSSPNIAKEMHIGHLRSTIIGDAIARMLIFIGHNVIKVNHIGDWGIQFGMILAFIKTHQISKKSKFKISDLEHMYKKSKIMFNQNTEFANLSRQYLIKIQSGEKKYLNIWKKITNITISKNQKIYKLLNVSLKRSNIMGESFYKNMLSKIISDLEKKKISVINDGASVVFLKEFKNKSGNPIGVIIKKKDGGFLYSTTDIACLKYRCQILKAERILYFVDTRQYQHLMQVFYIAKKAGYIPKNVSFEHHTFGMILSKNGTPFKTREGENIKLFDLLKKSIAKAYKLIKNKNPKFKEKTLINMSKSIGIGAIKYFDLSKNRNNNYIFDWDNMINFEGNTAPYIQYAYSRIMSILKKSINNENFILKKKISITLLEERNLVIHIIKFKEILDIVEKKCMTNFLCNYLYDLSNIFSNFYEKCKVLCDNKNIQFSRLKLVYLTSKILKSGLNILGIKTIKKM